MKDFFKTTLASALGFIIASILLSILSFFIFFGMVGSLASTAGKQPFTLQNNSVLHLKLDGVVQDRVADSDPFTELLSQATPQVGLNDIVGAIRKAKSNDKIKGIYLDTRMFAASNGTLEEIRKELLDFKESDKFIVAYADTYLQSGYYLASVADKVIVNPHGALDLHGLSSTPMFYKDALAKLGIKMRIFKVGTYKSAVEPFTETEMSAPNREQVGAFLNDIWGFMRADLAQSRGMSSERIDELANEFTLMKDVDYLLQNNLVDSVLYETEMQNYLRQLLEIGEDAKIASATVSNMKNVKGPSIKKSSSSIALLYATGNITSGGGSSGIQDKYIVNELEKLRKDKDIKAVVLRVNSGGGSAYASEQIWKAVSDLKKEKPVVVSMGDVAASGGYYIACNADKIFANPTTITGSIGIFGMFPDMTQTLKNIGVTGDVVKTNEFADFGNMTRSMNVGEIDMMQSYIERGYDLFVTRCADGRNMPKEKLMEYAEGRVWTGNQALEIGLIDELGGISEAIESAAELANLGKNYSVFEYPKLRSPLEELLDQRKDALAAKALQNYLGDHLEIFMLLKDVQNQDYIQARMPYDLNIK